MAESPAHRFGQIIGDVLEKAVEPFLQKFADESNLYLDKKGPRLARPGNKLTWKDLNGNTHDLDFVIEKNGTTKERGLPVAFIETAWRRYTKHSKNKVQEIQGAVLPLFETYKHVHPFVGVVLAGVFTEGALSQLKSLGFSVSYFSYDTVLEAFKVVGINAHFDEDTPDREFAQKVKTWDRLSPEVQLNVSRTLVRINAEQIALFMDAMMKKVTRKIKSVRIFPVHGRAVEWPTVDAAIAFIEKYDQKKTHLPVVRYEIQVLYTNSDRIGGEFAAKADAIQFLQGYQSAAMR